ncbi:MAG: MFS transporter, partial [Mycobacterium sp.]
LHSGTETAAYWVFLASYVVAAVMTWMVYIRRPVSAPALPPHLPQPLPEAESARL